MKNFKDMKINTKFMIVFSIILVIFTLLDIKVTSYKEKDIFMNEIKRWTSVFGESVRVSLNTLMREGKMDIRFSMLQAMNDELDGLKSIRIIRSKRVDELFREQNEKDIIPNKIKTIKLLEEEVAEVTVKLKKAKDIDLRDELKDELISIEETIRANKDKIEKIRQVAVVDKREMIVDQLDRDVLRSREPIYKIKGDNARVLIPYTVREKGCSKASGCHKYAKEGEVLGAINIEFSIKEINEQMMTHNLQGAGIGSAKLVILCMVIFFLLSIIVTKKIRYMMGALEKMAAGDLSFRFAAHGDDEMGKLAKSFNSSMDKLIQLIQKKEKAEASNKAKSEFLANITHELRTPLTAMLGFAQCLEDDQAETLDDIQKECVQEIILTGWHLNTLINDLLDLSTIEAGRLTLVIEPIHIRHIIDESLRIIAPLADSKGVTVEDKSLKAFNQIVQGDKIRLKQALLNLLSNAVKYNKDEGRVTLNCEKTNDGMFRISVTDTGAGISDDLQKKLFQPFERLGAEKKGIGGTGIGLAITKTMIEHQGGRLGYKSFPDKGSTFWIDLIIKETYSEVKDFTDEKTVQLEGEKHSLIYIEENISNIKLVSQLLSRRPDIELHTAQTTEFGLELVRHHNPTIVLVNLQNFKVKDIETLEYLQRNKETKNIPIVTINASTMENDIKILDTAILYHLTEPINSKKLMDIINKALQH